VNITGGSFGLSVFLTGALHLCEKVKTDRPSSKNLRRNSSGWVELEPVELSDVFQI
jgi:hypothetical protein